MGEFLAILFLAWLLAIAALLFRKRILLAQLWAEPVLRRPVLIIESDDWGAGPLTQTEALQKLSALLLKFSDKEGRHPVMTLGLVLATADSQAIKANGVTEYQRLGLDDECYAELRQSIADGVGQKVFSVQLHGMEHFWPAALMQSANSDTAVRQWLIAEGTPQTEQLPSYLQSRWLNAAVLPAAPLAVEQIASAVSEEVSAFRGLFGEAGIIVVPPTFVWNQQVEQVWAKNGVDVLVTPGQRYEGRDAEGRVTPSVERIFNGQHSEDGLIYIVRNDYFEPAQGHRSEKAIEAVKNKTAAGRPTLLETHRFNFIGTGQKTIAAFRELEQMLVQVCRDFPEAAFISTAELAHIYRHNDQEWLDYAVIARVRAFINRCSADYSLWRSFKLTGLAILLTLASMILPARQQSLREGA